MSAGGYATIREIHEAFANVLGYAIAHGFEGEPDHAAVSDVYFRLSSMRSDVDAHADLIAAAEEDSA